MRAADLKSSTKELREEMQGGQQELRSEMHSGQQNRRTEMRSEFQELRAEIKSLQRSMLFGFFSLGGLILTYAGFQIG